MSTGGWFMLIVSWSVIAWLTVFTIWRTLRAKGRNLSAPLDIEARIEADEAKQREDGTGD